MRKNTSKQGSSEDKPEQEQWLRAEEGRNHDKVESTLSNFGEGPVLGGTPVWWRGSGWKSSQAMKPSRGPDAVSLASSPSGNMEGRPVGSVSKHDKCGRPAGEARDLSECVHTVSYTHLRAHET